LHVAEITGAALFAKALKTQGAQHMFGMPGIPMIPIGPAVQAEDIHYYAMHHEMPATAAAQPPGTSPAGRGRDRGRRRRRRVMRSTMP
jgi:hypothetical protein